MILYLIEIDENGNTIQLCTVDGNKEDFDSKKWKVFENYDEANSVMGKRWNGSNWEEIPKKEEPSPETQPTELEILKNEVQSMKENQITMLEGIASLYDEIAK